MPILYVIAGPTASGKTALSLPLATRLNAEILIADSRQVYRGMDIGTAKPTPAGRARIPHHGLDLREPDETFSAAEFLAYAHQAIADITSRGKSVLLVGGTGMYLKALAEGWDFGGVAADADLRALLRDRLRADGLAPLVAELCQRDPAADELIDLQNPARVLRALEICIATNRPLTEVRGRSDTPYTIHTLVLSRPKAELDARIAQRLAQMIHEGWLDEVRQLRTGRTWPAESPALSGIGYDELGRHLAGEYALHYALERIAARTRQYAKRQLTWFRAQENYQWLEVSGEVEWGSLAEEVAEKWGLPVAL